MYTIQRVVTYKKIKEPLKIIHSVINALTHAEYLENCSFTIDIKNIMSLEITKTSITIVGGEHVNDTYPRPLTTGDAKHISVTVSALGDIYLDSINKPKITSIRTSIFKEPMLTKPKVVMTYNDIELSVFDITKMFKSLIKTINSVIGGPKLIKIVLKKSGISKDDDYITIIYGFGKLSATFNVGAPHKQHYSGEGLLVSDINKLSLEIFSTINKMSNLDQ